MSTAIMERVTDWTEENSSSISGRGRDSAACLRNALGAAKGDNLTAVVPMGIGDATAGAENELLTIVIGPRDKVDLARAITESNFYKNLERRTASGDMSKSLIRDIEDYLSDNRDNTRENSWVYFPADLMSPHARSVWESDLCADKRNPGAKRADAGRFSFQRNGATFIRIPVSYLLKLSLADAVSVTPNLHPLVRRTGERIMKHFLNDNTSPETFSFHPVAATRECDLGGNLGAETLRRFLLVQLMTMYANDKFELRARGQETIVCFAPHTPLRQKQLNELVPDSFYRDLFMSPCLSGWDQGEAKHEYMSLCHQVLSRSRLNTMGKLRECGILSRDLVILPTVSNTSLANNGTHISLGSRRMNALMTAGGSDFTPADEKNTGDLVAKIVEHFLPLFVGTYSADPYRLDFCDFHPELVTGFLPHELDFTHLRMLWRRWKGKASMKCFGYPMTPFGPRNFDRFLAGTLGLRGDWIPDQRLTDYLVCPLSTERSPAFDGKQGNDERLKRDLAEMGIFDPRMSTYALYRQRFFAKAGYCGFEGRYYSQFSSIARDMAEAVNLQRLVTALAYQYVLSGAVKHEDIPDRPEIESERRQIFFGSAVGVPTFFVDAKNDNRFMSRILSHTKKSRISHRYPGRTRVYNMEYQRGLIAMIEHDAADLIESLGMSGTILDLKSRIEPGSDTSAQASLMSGILKEADASTPLSVSADVFNRAAERYYRGDLLRQFVVEALDLLENDLHALLVRASSGLGEETPALMAVLSGEDPVAFLDAVRGNVMEGRASQSVLVKLINLLLMVIHHHCESSRGET